ncbi:HNH endonuclease signature motif containing protein [Actinoplanes sp. ATCC 53533]|uniref:HNH endonuclease signature motif containing protein n=1 Tax=Actinoplanes sp. ATCC 53533 TaxID=1288362 RepID=UPI00131543EA|nr:HNH endonuclease signature motif containing protein [Actinoplanes sp. ATCC 53533]
MLELLSETRRAAAACAAAPAWAVSDRDLVECLQQSWAAVQQLTAVTAHLIQQAQAQGLPQAHAATSTAVWLRHQLRVSPGAAVRLVKIAEALHARPVLDTEVCAGTVSADHATAIAAKIADLPAEVGREVTDKAEVMLVDWADDFDPATLGRLGGRILEHVAPEAAEQREADFLARQEARAHHRRAFTLSPLGNGQVRLSGYLDVTGAGAVTAALDPLCHPRYDPAEERTPAQRRADALVDICIGASRGGSDLPGQGRDPVQMVVTIPFTTLTEPPANTEPTAATTATTATTAAATAATGSAATGSAATGSAATGSAATGTAATGGQTRDRAPQTGAHTNTRPHGHGSAGNGVGWLDTGAPISPAEARRLACDAHIVPAVLGGDSQVLDLGRARRLFTGPLRRALILRDHGCAFPHCDRPARWTEGHHLIPWADGGTTTLANASLVCRRHHRLLHNDSGWQARLGPDGHPEFLPPATLDPERRPQRNLYHRRQ